uniref:Uncharacterized protein n=1 Tax=Brassica campestris TaxID=3711 RepID=M4EXE7_BRACM
MTLYPLSPLSREPSPLKWTQSHLERNLRLLHLANVAPIEEDLASSTTMASHLLVLSPPIEVHLLSPCLELLFRMQLRSRHVFELMPELHLFRRSDLLSLKDSIYGASLKLPDPDALSESVPVWECLVVPGYST